MTMALKYLFWLLIAKPITHFILGLNVRHLSRLPKDGPCIIIANHNSHLDTLVLFNLFPWRLLRKIRPVAAADYFCKNKILRWFSTQIMGIIPIHRGRMIKGSDPFELISSSLHKGEIILLYPEGTRGEPEQMQSIKKGIHHLAKKHPTVPIIPIFMHGLGKSLPKGEFILVPFFCDIFIGNPLIETEDADAFVAQIQEAFANLAAEHKLPPWQH